MLECPICLSEIENEKCTTFCRHVFHSSCIFRSLQTSNLCPCCRVELVKQKKDTLSMSILRIFEVSNTQTGEGRLLQLSGEVVQQDPSDETSSSHT